MLLLYTYRNILPNIKMIIRQLIPHILILYSKSFQKNIKINFERNLSYVVNLVKKTKNIKLPGDFV